MTDQRPVAPIARDFVSVSRQQLHDSQARIEACLGKLSEDQIWSRQVEVENAVGNLVLHLCGNVTQWLLGGIGRQSVFRDRATEFSRREPLPRQQLVETLQDVMARSDAVLVQVTPDELLRRRTIQGHEVTGLQAIYTSVDHFAMHTGQIISATKRMTGEDLGFYASLQRGVTPGATP